ncbi:MAG: single-stranded-DNA-specific exonuclease RecJ [Planctomycetes bacterium]|nr:single-stranded-DNA-specific exonuclease RecJ [Planctomycetota bacterium]
MDSSGKVWRLLPYEPAHIDRLSRELQLSPIVAQLLLNRNLSDAPGVKRFLDAPLKGLYEPERLPGAADAANRLFQAVQAKRPICIYGDYDVDGVTGTAILLTLLRMLGATVDYYIPNRLDEGYGLSVEALRTIAGRGAALVVTVDCGIASVVEADEARRLGLELIVTDHHEPAAMLPQAAALVHPRLPGADTPYPFGDLCGSGVALKLAWALCKRACASDKVTEPMREFLMDAVVLAALGTIADVVPLQDENRILVRYGLTRLQSHPSVGLQALMQVARLQEKSLLVSMDIAFGLAPRLNAAGRLGAANHAVELLTTASAQRAEALAQQLQQRNLERQTLERDIFQQARELAEGCNGAPALVLAKEAWHPGLLGIVASRLVETFRRPALMISLRDDGGPAQGSGRSAADLPLHEALGKCASDLVSHGGHARAAGFRILPQNIPAFREHFCEVAESYLGTGQALEPLVIDAEVPLAALTLGLVRDLDRLEPFGAANPQPRFLAGDLDIVGEPRKVGNGDRHLSFRVRQQGKDYRAIAFFKADRVDSLLSADRKCSLVFTPRINEWQGFKSVELEVCDFQPGARARLA